MSKLVSFHKRALLILAMLAILPTSIMAQSELLITWTGTPGEFENTITADTLANGDQAHDVYVLEKNRVYLQIVEINVNSSFTVRGQAYDPNNPADVPATIQPLPGPNGLPAFNNWPTANFQMFGDNATLTLENLLFNGAFADQSTHLWSIAVPRGVDQKVDVDNNVWSDYQLTFATFGENTDFHFNNGIVKACPSYPGGVFFNGFAWGGGSWMGTIDTLIVQNSSIMNMWGEAMVIYDQVENYGLIDHCTFANIVMGICFYRGQNNLTFSNNLFYNVKVYGQSTNAQSIGLWGGVENGQGIMAVLSQSAPDSASIANGRGWDHLNRNVSYHHNAWVNDQNVLNFYQTPPWSWVVTDTNGVQTTEYDTMLAVSDQYKWVGDSTLAQMANDPTITEYNNVQATANLRLAPDYINAMIPRIWDFRDDNVMQTYTGEWWQYEHDNDPINVEWPIHEDLRYDTGSPAATASETGGPVGDPRWDVIVGIGDDAANRPTDFALQQNYPNPFNPTTEIRFTIGQVSDVKLTVYNTLGQVVGVLLDESTQAGKHSLKWDGRDHSGNAVPTGLYFYTLTDGSRSLTKKMLLMK